MVVDLKMIGHEGLLRRKHDGDCDWERLEGRVLATTAIGMNYGHKDDDEF